MAILSYQPTPGEVTQRRDRSRSTGPVPVVATFDNYKPAPRNLILCTPPAQLLRRNASFETLCDNSRRSPNLTILAEQSAKTIWAWRGDSGQTCVPSARGRTGTTG